MIGKILYRIFYAKNISVMYFFLNESAVDDEDGQDIYQTYSESVRNPVCYGNDSKHPDDILFSGRNVVK